MPRPEVPIVVDSDSHICFRVGHVEGALEMLEEIGFPEELIINSSILRGLCIIWLMAWILPDL